MCKESEGRYQPADMMNMEMKLCVIHVLQTSKAGVRG